MTHQTSTRSRKTKPTKHYSHLMAAAIALLLGPSLAASAATLELDRTSYQPGETMTVTFTESGRATNAWAGVVPSHIPHGSEAENDRHDIAFSYLQGATSGTLTLQAPSEPGRYDVRLHDTDSDGREVASVSFQVRPVNLRKAKLELDKKRYIPGETITVRFQAPAGLPTNAWAGIVPSEIPHGSEAKNDRHDLAYHHLQQRGEGTLDFIAPAQPGRYDVRMNDSDSDGREIASISFSVAERVTAALIAEQLTARGRVPLYGIRFASGKASLGADSTTALAEVGQLLLGNPSLTLRVEGHTDNRGDTAFNQRLSERRAGAVRLHLIETFSIAPGRMTTAGLGDSQPIATNETAAGREQNRRVELVQ